MRPPPYARRVTALNGADRLADDGRYTRAPSHLPSQCDIMVAGEPETEAFQAGDHAMSLAAATNNQGASTRGLYEKLEDRILARDQIGASECYYDLALDGRPLAEMLREAVRIHGPYTHVPYHERIDDGFVNFVNNDHCLLSARATLHLSKWLPAETAGLPMAQTIWYIPTGLDIWNQRINKAPGHYARGKAPQKSAPPKPVVHWPDQEPERLDGPLRDRLDQWMTLVHRGRVLEAYRVFLRLMQNKPERKAVLAELVFAGLIDLQDRAFLNRSYTTGHKSYRARATVELGTVIGWDDAHPVLYAGALDIAVGPRWYSTYEMACNCVTHYLEQQKISAVPYAGATARELALLANSERLTGTGAESSLEVLLRQHEPAYLEQLSRLLLAGKGPRQILDVLQIGAAQALLETQEQPQLLHFATLLRILQYAWLVLRFLRASATPEAAVLGRLFPQPQRLASEEYWRWKGLCNCASCRRRANKR